MLFFRVFSPDLVTKVSHVHPHLARYSASVPYNTQANAQPGMNFVRTLPILSKKTSKRGGTKTKTKY